MLIDGHRFNDNIYDQALVATEFPVDLALVDRVEIVRGPGSALYVQDEISLHRRLTATNGGRFDWWQGEASTGRPRLGLVYRSHADTAVKVLYGAAYRRPSVFERYYYGPDPASGEPLGPERVETTEVVYEQGYSYGELTIGRSKKGFVIL